MDNTKKIQLMEMLLHIKMFKTWNEARDVLFRDIINLFIYDTPTSIYKTYYATQRIFEIIYVIEFKIDL